MIEKRLQDTIYRRFGIDPENEEIMREVTRIDDAMLYHEFLALGGFPLYDRAPEKLTEPCFDFQPFAETERQYLDVLNILL